jgi:hypothetical protein
MGSCQLQHILDAMCVHLRAHTHHSTVLVSTGTSARHSARSLDARL